MCWFRFGKGKRGGGYSKELRVQDFEDRDWGKERNGFGGLEGTGTKGKSLNKK